jgi:phage terminase large subunit
MPKRQVAVTRIYDRNVRATDPIIVNVGGARSGKSYSILQLFLQKLTAEKHKEILIARKTLPSLRITAYKVFVDLLQDYGYYPRCTHNKTNLTIKYKSNTVYFLSIDDPEKIKSTEFNYVFLEEANEFTYRDFMTLKMRMSAPTTDTQPNKMYLALNPSDEFSWINQKLIHWDNVALIKSTYRDNPHLSKTYTQDLEDLKEIDPELYKIYTLGEYATLSNIIYQNHVIDRIFPSRFHDEYYGLDFGYNYPAALVHIGNYDKELYEREIIYETHLTNPELIELMAERKVSKTIPIYADAAEPKSIEDIYKAGYNIHPANKQVMDGIKDVKTYKIHIHYESANLIKERKTYKWRQDKNGNTLDEPVKFNDHCMDAERYAIHGTAPDPNRFTVVSSKRDW